MLDRSSFWPPAVAETTRLTGDDLTVTLLRPVPQVMVSGDLDGFCMAHGLTEPVGLLGRVAQPRYALRLARGRMLAVGVVLDHAACGWEDGIATTPMTGSLAVVQIAGPRAMELFARASAVDPELRSPSAALNFAGVTAALCREAEGLRLHIDRGLVPYLFDWVANTNLAGATDSIG